MKTQISLILLGLGLACGSAYAGTVSEPLPVSNDINVTAPDQQGMWSFGVEAVLMQPTNKTFDYAHSITVAGTNDPVTGAADIDLGDHHYSVNEGYYWWFGADISYAFPGKGRDVTLAYEGLHGTDSDSQGLPSALSFSSLVSDFTGLPYDTAKGKTDTNYDAGDLLFGQKMDVGQRIRLHPFLGLRYAHLNITETGEYYSASGFPFDSGGALTENAELENTFNGIGPRLGSDAQISLGQGFSIRARLGLSALIGSSNINNDAHLFLAAGPGGPGGVVDGDNVSDSQTRVIPEIDGRLGLNYTHPFDVNNALGFELGWQATNYFNVIADQPQVTLGSLSSNGIGPNIGNPHYDVNANFGLQGPYARVQLDIA